MFVCANFVSGLHRFQCWQNVKWLIRWWPRKSQGTSRDSLTKLFDFLSFRILFMNYSSDPKPKSERNNSEENPIKILLRNRDFSSNGEGKILVNSVIKHIVTISSPCISKMFIKYSALQHPRYTPKGPKEGEKSEREKSLPSKSKKVPPRWNLFVFHSEALTDVFSVRKAWHSNGKGRERFNNKINVWGKFR